MSPYADHLFAGEKETQVTTMDESVHPRRSDSGLSFSSASSTEILGTPFDIGSQRFEYPFPKTQGSPTEPFMPLSSSMNSSPHAHLPHWPMHFTKSFPLSSPLSRMKTHPKLNPTNTRVPPVPPGLVKRRSRFNASLHSQMSEESSDKSDSGEVTVHGPLATRSVTSSPDATPQRALSPNLLSHVASGPVINAGNPLQDSESSDHTAAEDSAQPAAYPGRSQGLVNSPTVSASASTL
ncbi:hypothetical protein EV401DRAFT_89686 [Pisolithus croceorrhizus]|nr:hypothetical protein EV401DRAFT_89686 [Pisolithus croceorrhizus]